jgi:hypothetical protein
MTQTTLEYVLNSIYVALVSAGLDARQRALANDTMARCADLPCAPVCAPEVLRRVVTPTITNPRPPERSLGSLAATRLNGCVIA